MNLSLEQLNRMQADGVVSLYAVGGSAAATFYIQPAVPLEADIFVLLPSPADASSLAPIYQYLVAGGGVSAERGAFTIETWSAKFLPVVNDLQREALDESVENSIGGVRIWILTAEHLACMALRSGLPDDMALLSQLLKSEAVDRNKLHLMLHRHDLGPQWHQFTNTHSEK